MLNVGLTPTCEEHSLWKLWCNTWILSLCNVIIDSNIWKRKCSFYLHVYWNIWCLFGIWKSCYRSHASQLRNMSSNIDNMQNCTEHVGLIIKKLMLYRYIAYICSLTVNVICSLHFTTAATVLPWKLYAHLCSNIAKIKCINFKPTSLICRSNLSAATLILLFSSTGVAITAVYRSSCKETRPCSYSKSFHIEHSPGKLFSDEYFVQRRYPDILSSWLYLGKWAATFPILSDQGFWSVSGGYGHRHSSSLAKSGSHFICLTLVGGALHRKKENEH